MGTVVVPERDALPSGAQGAYLRRLPRCHVRLRRLPRHARIDESTLAILIR